MKSARAKLFVPFLMTLLTFSTHAIANGGGGGGGADVEENASSAKASDVPESVYEHARGAGDDGIVTSGYTGAWAIVIAKFVWQDGNPMFDAEMKKFDETMGSVMLSIDKAHFESEKNPAPPTKTASKENENTQHQKDVDKLIAESIEKSKTSSKYRAHMQKLADKGNMHAKTVIATLETQAGKEPKTPPTTRPADSVFNDTGKAITRDRLLKEFTTPKTPVKTASASKTGINQIN